MSAPLVCTNIIHRHLAEGDMMDPEASVSAREDVLAALSYATKLLNEEQVLAID